MGSPAEVKRCLFWHATAVSVGIKNSRESAAFVRVQTALQVLFLDKNHDKN